MKLLRANKIMVERYGQNLIPHDTVLPRYLLSILKSGLIKKDGGLFLNALLKKCSSVNKSNFPDLTGYEWFVNHIHIDGTTSSELVNFGMVFLSQLSFICKTNDIQRSIRGIISIDDTCVVNVTVGFHLLRSGETFLLDNLEGYEEECIAEFEL